MKVVDPDGVTWRVSRRWLPRYEGKGLRERLRQRRARRKDRDGDDGGWLDWLDIPGVDDFFAVVGIVIAIVLLVLFGIPALLALVDLVVVLAVGIIGIVARVAFRRPWTVEALSDGRVLETQVVGWRAAGAEIGRLAERIRAEGAEAAPRG